MATRLVCNVATGEVAVVTLTPSEEAAAAALLQAETEFYQSAPQVRIATDAAEESAVKADSQVITFLNMSPTQLDNWVDNNISNAATLAALRTGTATALKVLGRIAQTGARGRLLRNFF